MDVIGDLLKILLPALVVLYAMYLTVKAFLSKEFEKKVLDLKTKNTEIVLPIRLQAYERMALFLERIAPHNLIIRLNDPGYNAGTFQQVLLAEIRNEFNHNLSQQVYMTDSTWSVVKGTMEEIISIINQSASEVPADAKGIELAKMIFENLLKRNEDPSNKALKVLKKEIQQVF